MTDEFDKPGTASNVEWEEYLGKLLIIWPISKEANVKTQDYGEKDAIRADMAIVDGADGPEELPDILIFPLVLQGQLRRKMGKTVLGRLGQGEAKAKQKPPWKLQDATEADEKLARDYLSKRTTSSKPSGNYDDVPF